MVIVPSPSESKSAKASLYSFSCRHRGMGVSGGVGIHHYQRNLCWLVLPGRTCAVVSCCSSTMVEVIYYCTFECDVTWEGRGVVDVMWWTSFGGSCPMGGLV